MSIKIVKHWELYLEQRGSGSAIEVGTVQTIPPHIDNHGFLHFTDRDGTALRAVAISELASYTLSPVYAEQEDGA